MVSLAFLSMTLLCLASGEWIGEKVILAHSSGKGITCKCGQDGPSFMISKARCCMFLRECDIEDDIGEGCCAAFKNCKTCYFNHPKCLKCPANKTGIYCNQTETRQRTLDKFHNSNLTNITQRSQRGRRHSDEPFKHWVYQQQEPTANRSKRLTFKSKDKFRHPEHTHEYGIPVSSWTHQCTKTWKSKPDDNPKHSLFMPFVKEHKTHFVDYLNDNKKPHMKWTKDCIRRFIYDPYTINMNNRPACLVKSQIVHKAQSAATAFHDDSDNDEDWSVSCTRRSVNNEEDSKDINRSDQINFLPVEKSLREYFSDYIDDDEKPRHIWSIDCYKRFTYIRPKKLQRLMFPEPRFGLGPDDEDTSMDCSKHSEFRRNTNACKPNNRQNPRVNTSNCGTQDTTTSCLKRVFFGYVSDDVLFPKNYSLQTYENIGSHMTEEYVVTCEKRWLKRAPDFMYHPDDLYDDTRDVHVKWDMDCSRYRAPKDSRYHGSGRDDVDEDDVEKWVTHCKRLLISESKLKPNNTNETKNRGHVRKEEHEVWIESCVKEWILPPPLTEFEEPEDPILEEPEVESPSTEKSNGKSHGRHSGNKSRKNSAGSRKKYTEFDEPEEGSSITEKPARKSRGKHSGKSGKNATGSRKNDSGERGSSLQKNRPKRKTKTCEYPQYLPHASLSCVEHSSYVECVQKCVWGYTLGAAGRNQTIKCYYEDDKWVPNPFAPCKAKVQCNIKLTRPGDFECFDNTVDFPTYCNITCNESEDFPASPYTKYQCGEDGEWNPELPFCAVSLSQKLKPKFYN